MLAVLGMGGSRLDPEVFNLLNIFLFIGIGVWASLTYYAS